MIIDYISSYIKNVCTFLIFITFIGIISTSSKYKKYIDLILGFILIFVILSPLTSIINKTSKPLDNLFLNMSLNMDKSILEKEGKFYSDEQNKMVLKTYKNELNKQLENIITKYDTYTVISSNIIVNESLEQFGAIEEIHIDLEENSTAKNKKPFIRVEQIKVDISNKKNEEDEKIIILKNLLSDFYNLSCDNIYITVQKKK